MQVSYLYALQCIYKTIIKDLAIKIQMSETKLIENGFSYKEGEAKICKCFSFTSHHSILMPITNEGQLIYSSHK